MMGQIWTAPTENVVLDLQDGLLSTAEVDIAADRHIFSAGMVREVEIVIVDLREKGRGKGKRRNEAKVGRQRGVSWGRIQQQPA